MLKNGNKECPLTHEIVSYMYGELGSGSDLKFETHLADCMACTDEFAAVADPRFSVFEWQREEFAHLPTPEIVIPYTSAVDTGEAVSVIAAVRAWLGSLSFPVAVAAGVVVCIGLGLLVFNMIGRRDQQTAANIATPSNPQRVGSPIVPVPDPIAVEGEKKPIRTPMPIKASSNRPRPSIRRSPPASDQPVNNDAVAPNKIVQAAKTPALSAYDDNDDNSLRLADLFDEVGG